MVSLRSLTPSVPEKVNGFELADGGTYITFPDGDQELDLGSASGCLHLMASLAEGSGIQLPTTAAAALQLNGAVPLGALNPVALTALSPALNLASQAVDSQCFQLSSLFNPPNHVNQWHRTLLPCASGSCPSLFPIYPPTAPSLHFVDQAILRTWTLTLGGIGATLDTKKSSCPWPCWEWTLLSKATS
ncbi:hypothetical protein MC885_005542 [Smutsia gigantea]|nr:hypothetical protein MC885_005542 [Smutsia gigantea]